MKMRNMVFVIALSCSLFLSGQVRYTSASSFDSSLRLSADSLLIKWMDALLDYQCGDFHLALDGGILCPACARIHGRIGDAVLPLMYLAEKTKKTDYLLGAKRLMKWMEHVHRPDGSWMNDVNVSDWKGTTVFAAIALYEALQHHGHLLDDSTRNHWKYQLEEAGDFIVNNPFIYSRKREGMRNMNVNYSASATYALYAIGEMCARPAFKEKAREIADDLKAYFTQNDCFLYGEGPDIWSETKNGCLPVDLLYNVEESLPNLAYYATMAHDMELLSLIERSMDTHLEFMLPDGAWDNSWGTRSFKWTYWGGRTSDGFMGGYYLLAGRRPVYAEAIRRNIELLKRATHDGLLYGGMHYWDCAVLPCIHHTIGHAKALASFLELPPLKVDVPNKLPRDTAYGMKFFRDIRTWLISQGAWRATFTGYDAEYKVKGTHPMGGALSLLWYSHAGPVFAATMNQYKLIEAPNMQSNTRKYLMGGTPRVELEEGGVIYSNLDDVDADIACHTENGALHFKVNTHLVDINQQAPSGGSIPVSIHYVYSEEGVSVSVESSEKSVCLILPVIASPLDSIKINSSGVYIEKEQGTLEVLCESGYLKMAPTDDDGRIFNPVPGFSFLPLQFRSGNKEQKIRAKIRFR